MARTAEAVLDALQEASSGQSDGSMKYESDVDSDGSEATVASNKEE